MYRPKLSLLCETMHIFKLCFFFPSTMALPLLLFPLLIQPSNGGFGVFFLGAVEDRDPHVRRSAPEENLQTTRRMIRHVASQVRRDSRSRVKYSISFSEKRSSGAAS
jgi:hypothetical protein